MPQDHLDYSFQPTEDPRCTALTLRGALTLSHIFGMQQQLHDVDADLLILDCTGLEYMDSAGLGVVVNGYVSQSDKGRRIALIGASERVWAIFTTTRVAPCFPRFPTVAAAEASL